ncbi:MAG: hypothetical protein V4588_07405 [Pseudomonadota bacterium]
MQKLTAIAIFAMLSSGIQVQAAEPAIESNTNTQLKVDDSEPKTDFNQTPPSKKTKAQLKKPKIGFKTTVKPEDMKSYNRSESGDVSAQ